MDLYNLGTTTWQDSQIIYHALAHLGREGLIIVEPGSPYVCLGCHQDATKELDLEFIEREHIPLVRREVGGGAVYLDRGQLFYQFVFNRNNPLLPKTKEEFQRFRRAGRFQARQRHHRQRPKDLRQRCRRDRRDGRAGWQLHCRF
jgi:lipoate-protein ligase A